MRAGAVVATNDAAGADLAAEVEPRWGAGRGKAVPSGAVGKGTEMVYCFEASYFMSEDDVIRTVSRPLGAGLDSRFAFPFEIAAVATVVRCSSLGPGERESDSSLLSLAGEWSEGICVF